jgi:hypothetical protein
VVYHHIQISKTNNFYVLNPNYSHLAKTYATVICMSSECKSDFVILASLKNG